MRSCPAVADRMGKIKRVSKRLGNDLKFPVALSRMVYGAGTFIRHKIGSFPSAFTD
jgi:hypothetical protein